MTKKKGDVKSDGTTRSGRKPRPSKKFEEVEVISQKKTPRRVKARLPKVPVANREDDFSELSDTQTEVQESIISSTTSTGGDDDSSGGGGPSGLGDRNLTFRNHWMYKAFLVCGLDANRAASLQNAAKGSLKLVATMAKGDGEKWTKKINNSFKETLKLRIDEIDYQTLGALESFGWLCKNLFRAGINDVDITDSMFNLDELDIAEVMMAEEQSIRDEMATVTKPEKYSKDGDWFEFERCVFAYLRTQLGMLDVPLAYVIVDPDNFVRSTREDDVIINAFNAKDGSAYLKTVFERDSIAVGKVLKRLVSDDLKDIQAKEDLVDGRLIWQQMKLRAAGLKDKSVYVRMGLDRMFKLLYRDEHVMNYNTYLAKLHDCFDKFRLGGVVLPEIFKSQLMLYRMDVDKSSNLYRQRSYIYAQNQSQIMSWQECVSHITATIGGASGTVDKTHKQNGNRTRTRNVASLKRDNNGELVPVKKPNKAPVGVDLDMKNPTAFIDPDDYRKLPKEWKQYLAYLRKKEKDHQNDSINNNNNNSGDKQVKWKDRTTKKLKEMVSRIESMESKMTGSQDTKGRAASEGILRKSTIARIVSTTRVSKTETGGRWVPKPGTCGPIEFDTHADTCVLGANFIPLAYHPMICNVSGFAGNDRKEGIQVVDGATAWTCPTDGMTYILIINQGLWFGDTLNHSLINPNQIRYNGITVQDNPFEDEVGIHTDVAFIPFFRRQTVVYCDTRAPTRDELENCQYITLTSDVDWDPSTVNLGIQEMGSQVQGEYQDSFCRDVINTPRIVSVADTGGRRFATTAAQLAKLWQIGLQQATNTLKHTTQNYIRAGNSPLFRRIRRQNPAGRYRRLGGTFYTDTLHGRVRSYHDNLYAQVFTNANLDFIYVVPMRRMTSEQIALSLKTFIQDVGIPSCLKSDRGSEVFGKDTVFQATCREYDITRKYFETARHEGNRAESAIRELKRRWKFDMYRKRVPRRFWDFALVYHAEILSRVSRRRDGSTGIENVIGITPDISDWLEFDFYCPVWYLHTTENTFDKPNARIGRWLGVSHGESNKLCYYILTELGKVIVRPSVQRLTKDDLEDSTIQSRLTEFDAKIIAIKDSDIVVDNWMWDDIQCLDIDESAEDDSETADYDPVTNEDAVLDVLEEADVTDQYIGAEVTLPQGGEKKDAVVVKRLRGVNGKPIGVANANPLLDTRRYVVRFQGSGEEDCFAANEIAANIFSQVDAEGRNVQILDDIVEHRLDPDGYSHSFLVQWKRGEATWVPMKELKAGNPIELAEYTVVRGISDRPAFKKWSKFVLRKRDRYIKRVKSRYWRTTHKLGIRLPHSVEEAYRLDEENGNNLWRDAINKEMLHVTPAFKVWDGDGGETAARKKLIGYQRIKCHMVFDIKMDFTRKARFVAGGHTTETPASLTYSSVVSRDSVRLLMMTAALHDVDLLSVDIGNAYLNAKCRERIWTIAGPEFDEWVGLVLIVDRALYGLKSSGAAWRSMLRESILDMGFTDTTADHDVYRRRTRKGNYDYYELICVYVDDIIVVSHRAMSIMRELGQLYRFKEEPKPPEMYLGANVEKVSEDGHFYWQMDAVKYIKSIVERIEMSLKEKGLKLHGKKQSMTPLPVDYHPELESSALLNDEGVTKYQEYIGMLRWACELGRFDILLETSLLSQYLAAPRKGHLDKCINIFSYLKYHSSFPLKLRSNASQIEKSKFGSHDWSEFYPDAKEQIPANAPEPLGRAVVISAYVDASHAGNKVTRRSHSGHIIYVNSSPIIWYSKRQNTVEASSFGSEFNALRVVTEHIIALRYKLRMFGLHIDGPGYVYSDNEAVSTNSSVPESTLDKRHNSICYHMVREAVAAGVLAVGWIPGTKNPADLFTKILARVKRGGFLDFFGLDPGKWIG